MELAQKSLSRNRVCSRKKYEKIRKITQENKQHQQQQQFKTFSN
jgi:hypothetical protein